MPVYTYRCENCGVQFERHQSFTDAPLKTCPECRKKALKKVITPTKIILKVRAFTQQITSHLREIRPDEESRKEGKRKHTQGK